MTERISNAEIEDVLSSIRRLVSDDLRPAAVAAPPPVRPSVPRLVLTPALRVNPEPVRPTAEPEPADDGLAGRLAELEALMARQNLDFEDDAPAPGALRPGFDPLPEEQSAAEAPFIGDDTDGDDPAQLAWTEPATSAQEPLPADAWSDEALLRELIRDVLREELQGPMGERVTRNLRKMVRSEIARALTARGIA